MKISVCGKGGSGKSTVVVLLAHAMHDKGFNVLVVDSDESNSGLHTLLGFDEAPRPLMDLVGGKKKVKQGMGLKSADIEAQSKTMVLAQRDIWLADIPPEYVRSRDGVSLITIGKILQSLEGCACPMGVLSRELLRKLRLRDDQIAVVDMEAGVEHFGRGIETSVDSVLVVVEPSFESLELAEKMNNFATGVGIDNTWAILNKITSEDLFSRLEAQLSKRNVRVLGAIHYDPDVFDACLEGYPVPAGKAVEDMEELVGILLTGKPLQKQKGN